MERFLEADLLLQRRQLGQGAERKMLRERQEFRAPSFSAFIWMKSPLPSYNPIEAQLLSYEIDPPRPKVDTAALCNHFIEEDYDPLREPYLVLHTSLWCNGYLCG